MLTITINGPVASGKSTLAVIVARALREAGYDVEHLDDAEVVGHYKGLPLGKVQSRKVGIRSALARPKISRPVAALT